MRPVECIDIAVRIVIEHVFALEHTAAALIQVAHTPCYDLLSRLSAALIEALRHKIIIRSGYLIHPHRSQRRPIQKTLGINLVYTPYAGHYRGTVRYRQPLADMYVDRFQPLFGHNLGRRSPLSLKPYLTLTDKGQGNMSKLYKVAACADASVARDKWVYVAVDKLDQQ